jgi:hypothetical protein
MMRSSILSKKSQLEKFIDTKQVINDDQSEPYKLSKGGGWLICFWITHVAHSGHR